MEAKSVPALDLLPPEKQLPTPEQLAILNVLSVVAYPEQVRVSITCANQYTMVEFEVADSDKGKVIGKNGHTISSIRSLVSAASGGKDTSYLIHLLEDDKGRHRRPHKFRPRRGDSSSSE